MIVTSKFYKYNFVLLKSKQKTIYINSFFYTPNSIPFFYYPIFSLVKKID